MSHLISARSAGNAVKLPMLLLGALACVLTGTAGAADAGVPSRTVKYTQQSLASDGGVRDLYRRITRAASEVCPDVSIRDLGVKRVVQQCRNAAIARAISQIDNPRLAALYAVRLKNG